MGRLASCYMDAATGLNYPVTGFSIRYEFGIFRQKIVDGWQMEFPDNWLEMGDVWLHTRKDDAVEVRFGGQVHEWMDGDKFKTAQTGYQSVIAVPPRSVHFRLRLKSSQQADPMERQYAAKL